MKAILYTEYGEPEVLKPGEVEKPVPQENEILVRVRAASVNFGDITARDFGRVTPAKFWMPLPLWLPARLGMGWSKPRRAILGSEFSGEVAQVGKAVSRFKVGQRVFGYRGMQFGAYAEYLCMAQEGMLAACPANMSFAEAASLPYGALTALSLLRKVALRPGQKVLVIGASGAIGSYALQLAGLAGAQVTGVCATPRLEMLNALGAQKVIDYTQEDFTRSGERYDLIFDVLGKCSFAECRDSLTPQGIYFPVSFKSGALLQMLWGKLGRGRRVVCALSDEKAQDLQDIKELVEAGKLKTVINRCFPLVQAAAAHRYAESGQKKGHVIITMEENS